MTLLDGLLEIFDGILDTLERVPLHERVPQYVRGVPISKFMSRAHEISPALAL